MAHYRIAQIDAFTDQVFGGNPAGVVLDAENLSDRQMQLVAREMNVSETAFVMDKNDSNRFAVRFFTPSHEVDLCGHATVATFWLLAQEGRLETDGSVAVARQMTGAGELEVQVQFSAGEPHEVMMSQVAPRWLGSPGWDGNLLDMLGMPDCRLDELPEPAVVSTGLADLLLAVPDREILWDLSPDFRALSQYCRERGIVSVHCFTRDVISEDCFVHCRDFAPAVGVPEDPATGTASGALAVYLVDEGILPDEAGRSNDRPVRMRMEQGHSVDRPGTIITEVIRGDDGRPESVRVGGAARVVIDGTLRLS